MMIKPTLHFREMGEAKFLRYVENIITKLKDHVDLFPLPQPTVVQLEDAYTHLVQLMADATYRDERVVILKNQQLVEMRRLIYELSLYVGHVAMGNSAIILAAGFMPTKPYSPRGAAPKPENFRVQIMLTNPGHVKLRVQAWKPTLVYQFEYRKKESGSLWQQVLCSKSSVIIGNLEPLQEYEFRVAYISRDPMITYSDIISSYVL